ncbi:hypothetical protein I203_108237 [Kwoniella mangroviensis CBS 8507]|uniref:hypothetical protein n=1 Tax=Kwoniella mangroviensis CBS 8507 TaxID=1296122 RepID=UPI00080CCACE|nr:uncharacterized protein I203_05128 [Kwoniella mangroviensis CBS 8507]OCF65453.1 hypothetical protein I203_05128 [Kwoniella mangroviensis CBS 8507]
MSLAALMDLMKNEDEPDTATKSLINEIRSTIPKKYCENPTLSKSQKCGSEAEVASHPSIIAITEAVTNPLYRTNDSDCRCPPTYIQDLEAKVAHQRCGGGTTVKTSATVTRDHVDHCRQRNWSRTFESDWVDLPIESNDEKNTAHDESVYMPQPSNSLPQAAPSAISDFTQHNLTHNSASGASMDWIELRDRELCTGRSQVEDGDIASRTNGHLKNLEQLQPNAFVRLFSENQDLISANKVTNDQWTTGTSLAVSAWSTESHKVSSTLEDMLRQGCSSELIFRINPRFQDRRIRTSISISDGLQARSVKKLERRL